MKKPKQKTIGITGGVATGKSTATAYLREKGFIVLDADALVHQLQEPGGSLYEAIAAHFGEKYFLSDGRLDRKKLSADVFSDNQLRAELSAFQDSIIRTALVNEKEQQTAPLFFMDIPLLFELRYETMVDETWLIDTTADKQIARLMTRNQLTEEEAKARIAAQLPLTEKRQNADRIIENNGSLASLYHEIDENLARLQHD